MINYYEVLNLDSNLVGNEFKKEWNKMQKKWLNRQNAHILQHRQEAERLLGIIQEAEKVLLDERSRQEYDQKIANANTNTRERQETSYQEEPAANIEDLMNEAWDFIANNRYADAIAVSKYATSLNPAESYSWSTLGYAHYLWDEYDAAVKAYKQAIELSVNHATLYHDLANVYLEHPDMSMEESVKLAADLNRRALDIDPDATSFKFQSAIISRLRKEHDKAISILLELSKADPENEGYRNELCTNYYMHSLAFMYFNEYDKRYYVINQEQGETAFSLLNESLKYASSEEDLADVNAMKNVVYSSLQTKYNSPGYRAFVWPGIGLFLALLSASFWLFLICAVLIGSIIKMNYVPVWKVNKLSLGL